MTSRGGPVATQASPHPEANRRAHTARACDLHRRFHGLTKADAFQHRMGAFSDAELADVLNRAVGLKADVAPSMWNG